MGIPPAPRGVPQIEVTFDIDANGIVQVSAKDKATGKEQQIKIQASGGLSEADIQKMVKEAELNAAEDKHKRGLVEARNNADGLIYSTEKTVADLGDKVSAEDKQAVETAVAELKGILDKDDVEAIKGKVNALTQVSMKLGEQLYRQSQETTQPANEAGAAHGDAPKNDKVVDADFTEVDDEHRRKSG
jgi:molecular chaperone DnaK